MVFDARAVSVAARKGDFWRHCVGMRRVAEGVSVGVAGVFHVGKTLAFGDGNNNSANRWRDRVAIVGLWLAAKSNVLAGMGGGSVPGFPRRRGASGAKENQRTGPQPG